MLCCVRAFVGAMHSKEWSATGLWHGPLVPICILCGALHHCSDSNKTLTCSPLGHSRDEKDRLIDYVLRGWWWTQTVDANNPPSKVEEREYVEFSGPVDSVYQKAKGFVELDVGTGEACSYAVLIESLHNIQSWPENVLSCDSLAS